MTQGRVTGSNKEQARALDLRTEIMDLDEFLQVSEHSLLDIKFSEIGQAPEVIQARNDADDHKVFMGVVPGVFLGEVVRTVWHPTIGWQRSPFFG